MVTQEKTKDSVDEFIDLINERMRQKEGMGRTGYKHPTPAGTPTTNYMHGPGGIFGVDGLERDVISTRVMPRGLIGELPAVSTIRMNPLYPYLTGFQADTGSEPNDVCDDPPVARNGVHFQNTIASH